jgi:hypothetical protein
MQILRQFWSALLEFLKSPRILIYLVIAVIVVGFELHEELASNFGFGECDRVDTAAVLFYQRYTTAEFRKPRAHYVRLAILSPETVPADVLASPCKKREYEASILTSLAKLGPSLIAIDFAYPPDSCKGKDDEARSTLLEQAIEGISGTIPIVMAASSKSERDFKGPDLSRLRKAGLTNRSLIQNPRFPFCGIHLTYGMSKIDCDTRRVPLFWWVYPDEEAVLNKSTAPEPHTEPSFSFETARTYDSDLQNVLDNFISNNRHPFISFIREDGFRPIDLRLLFDCERTDDLREMLLGKIVLVGERSDKDDLHDTVIGPVPGYLLHANYIEALLDDRYFIPTSPYLELLFDILGIFLIVVIFEVVDELKSIRVMLRPVVGFFLASVFVSILFVLCTALRTYFGRELIFWAPLLPLPFIEAIYSLRVRARKPPAV